MNNPQQEDRSLLEVREWKEQCRQEDEGLTYTEYRKKLHAVAEQIKSQSHIKLQKVGYAH